MLYPRRVTRKPARDIRATTAIDVVEAAYRLDGDETSWLGTVVGSARADLDTGAGVYAFTGHEEVPNLRASPAFAAHDLDPGFASRLAEVNRDVPADIYVLLRKQLVTCGGLVRSLGEQSPIVTHFRAVMEPAGIADGFSMFAQDAQGSSVTLAAPSRAVLDPAPRVRAIWRRVGLHVASALRLRRKLATQATTREALFDPSGVIHDASEDLAHDAPARRALARAIRDMERARTSAMRVSPDRALALWQGLVAGEWSLVEHWEQGGRRYIAAYRNRPGNPDPRALTGTERSLLSYLMLGASNKDMAYTLGLPAGTVSAAVTRILKKLGARRRVDLAVLADPSHMQRLDIPVGGEGVGVLVVDASPRGDAARSLSPAELEIVTAVLRGWSNERVARERNGSPRTVANHLRAIYAKLGITSRGELARAMAEAPGATLDARATPGTAESLGSPGSPGSQGSQGTTPRRG